MRSVFVHGLPWVLCSVIFYSYLHEQLTIKSFLFLFQYYPLEEALCGGDILSDFKPELIEMVLGHLTPSNIR